MNTPFDYKKVEDETETIRQLTEAGIEIRTRLDQCAMNSGDMSLDVSTIKQSVQSAFLFLKVALSVLMAAAILWLVLGLTTRGG